MRTIPRLHETRPAAIAFALLRYPAPLTATALSERHQISNNTRPWPALTLSTLSRTLTLAHTLAHAHTHTLALTLTLALALALSAANATKKVIRPYPERARKVKEANDANARAYSLN